MIDMTNLTAKQQRVKGEIANEIVRVTEQFMVWVDRHCDGLPDDEVVVLLNHVAGDDMADAWEDYCAENR